MHELRERGEIQTQANEVSFWSMDQEVSRVFSAGSTVRLFEAVL